MAQVQVLNIALEVFRIPVVYDASLKIVNNARGTPSHELREAVRDPRELAKMQRNSIVSLGLYAAIIVWAIAAQSWLPILFTFGARLFGGPLVWVVFFSGASRAGGGRP